MLQIRLNGFPENKDMYLGDRKTGCRFYEFVFHGFRSLLIENDCIRTVMLLDIWKGKELF